MSNFFGFGMFSFISVLFPIVFILILGVFMFTIGKGIKEWSFIFQEKNMVFLQKVI